LEDKGELRNYLAAERTFLAWVRTGLALMGFGFVVARFGLFLSEFQLTQGGPAMPTHRFSLFAGIILISAGIGVTVYAAWSHARLVEALNRGEFAGPHSPRFAVAVALFLALMGAAMALYLTLLRNS
jgi:putative membrane protein